MTKTKWQELIKPLIDAGYSQYEIAAFAGCSQALISALLHGTRGRRLSYEIAQKLVEMAEKARNSEISPANQQQANDAPILGGYR